jgi:hypothetical protein
MKCINDLYRINGNSERIGHPMARREIKGALKTSLEAEEQAVTDRFARADGVFASKAGPLPVETETETSRVRRDSFTMPASDYDLIAHLKERCLKAGVSANKSEVVRAGLTALAAMSDSDLLEFVRRLEKVKTGRPQHTL